jgi:hypothetical protein
MKADTLSKWLVPAVGFVIGLLMAAALLGQHASSNDSAEDAVLQVSRR